MIASRYGNLNVVRTEVTSQRVWSVDMRGLTTTSDQPNDATQVVPPGTFDLALTTGDGGDNLPIAEILIRWRGIDVSIVAQLTDREQAIEVLPEHLHAAQTDPVYRRQLEEWLCCSPQI